MKQYAIGDIHGNFKILRSALDWIEEQEVGEVVLLGDYIDRGPNSKEVVDLLIGGPPINWKWTIIKGNHEDLAVDAYKNEQVELDQWIINGGDKTLESYHKHKMPLDHIRFLESLPRYVWDNHRIFTHAAVVKAYPLDKQPEAITQWYRYDYEYDKKIHDRYVVHGHTPQKGKPFIGKHRCNLDVGAVWKDELLVAVFDTEIAGGPIMLKTIYNRYKGLKND